MAPRLQVSTYATCGFARPITRAIAIRPHHPHSVHMNINKLVRTAASRAGAWSLTTTKKSQAHGHSCVQSGKILKIAQEPISLETPIGENKMHLAIYRG